MKGVAIQSKRCALCRQDIPVDFFTNPDLLQPEHLLHETAFEGAYQWYYQGMNGWWQYDERASGDIEAHFKEGKKSAEMLIAGFLYIIDFENMMQYRRNDTSRRRKIKRDVLNIPDKKGVAGLKTNTVVTPHRRDGDGGEIPPVSGAVTVTSANPMQSPSVPNVASQSSGSDVTAVTSSGAPGSSPSASVPHARNTTPQRETRSAVDDLEEGLADLRLRDDPLHSMDRADESPPLDVASGASSEED